MTTVEAPALTVRLIDPNELPKVWQQVQPLLTEACSWSEEQFNLASVVDGTLDGSFRLAAFVEGDKIQSILVLTVSQFPTGKRILEVLLASGSAMKSWMKHEDELLSYAKASGCSAVRMIGREGLQKALSTWKRTAVVLEREID